MNKLELYRTQRGLTYESMAALVGMPKETVWRHCEGVSKPDASAIAAYMQHLELTFEELRPDLWSGVQAQGAAICPVTV